MYTGIVASITSHVCGSCRLHGEVPADHNTALLSDTQPEYRVSVPLAMPVHKLLSKGMAGSHGQCTVTGTEISGG